MQRRSLRKRRVTRLAGLGLVFGAVAVARSRAMAANRARYPQVLEPLTADR